MSIKTTFLNVAFTLQRHSMLQIPFLRAGGGGGCFVFNLEQVGGILAPGNTTVWGAVKQIGIAAEEDKVFTISDDWKLIKEGWRERCYLPSWNISRFISGSDSAWAGGRGSRAINYNASCSPQKLRDATTHGWWGWASVQVWISSLTFQGWVAGSNSFSRKNLYPKLQRQEMEPVGLFQHLLAVWACQVTDLLEPQFTPQEKRASPVAQQVKHPPAMQVTQETQVWSLGLKDPLEKEVATHSSILARKIPWTEKPGGLQSKGHKESDMTDH